MYLTDRQSKNIFYQFIYVIHQYLNNICQCSFQFLGNFNLLNVKGKLSLILSTGQQYKGNFDGIMMRTTHLQKKKPNLSLKACKLNEINIKDTFYVQLNNSI